MKVKCNGPVCKYPLLPLAFLAMLRIGQEPPILQDTNSLTSARRHENNLGWTLTLSMLCKYQLVVYKLALKRYTLGEKSYAFRPLNSVYCRCFHADEHLRVQLFFLPPLLLLLLLVVLVSFVSECLNASTSVGRVRSHRLN